MDTFSIIKYSVFSILGITIATIILYSLGIFRSAEEKIEKKRIISRVKSILKRFNCNDTRRISIPIISKSNMYVQSSGSEGIKIYYNNECILTYKEIKYSEYVPADRTGTITPNGKGGYSYEPGYDSFVWEKTREELSVYSLKGWIKELRRWEEAIERHNSKYYQIKQICFWLFVLLLIVGLVKAGFFIKKELELSAQEEDRLSTQKEEVKEEERVIGKAYKTLVDHRIEYKIILSTKEWSESIVVPDGYMFVFDCNGCETGNAMDVMVNGKIVTNGKTKKISLGDNLKPPVVIKFKAIGSETEVWATVTPK